MLVLVGWSPFPYGGWVISEGCRPLCWEFWRGDSTLAWAELRLLLPESLPPCPSFTGVRPAWVSPSGVSPSDRLAQHLLLREAELTRFPNLEFLTLFPGPFDIYLGMYQSTAKEKCRLLENSPSFESWGPRPFHKESEQVRLWMSCQWLFHSEHWSGQFLSTWSFLGLSSLGHP